jgi:hypothetical protein
VLFRSYCIDADIIHHLAGITDVPRTKNENNVAADEKIKLVAVEGTQNQENTRDLTVSAASAEIGNYY